MLQITPKIFVPLEEITIKAVLAQGPGGQKVNKTSSAVHLRFDILASSLPEECKTRLRKRQDRRISAAGVVTIKARTSRTFSHNRAEALARLQQLIKAATVIPKKRHQTRPSRASRCKRLEAKTRQSRLKSLRKPAAREIL